MDPASAGEAELPVVPGFTSRKRLGRGGMASVYLATQLSLDRPVAIKVMNDAAHAEEVARQRFENEARTIAHLSHPNIVAIHEVGRCADGRPYYVMPYLGSGDLSQRDLTNDEARVAQILHALLSALGYAHARGIVHRDVKRENVLFDADDRPMLADFGIALSRKGDVRLTTAGLAVGSSGGMAPEQARGEAVDGRADLYSVGVLAWEMLTGTMPFQADDGLALAIMHAQDPIPRLPAEKRHWQGFIDRAMAKRPADRFANAQEMIQALERIGPRQGGMSGSALAATQLAPGNRWKQLLVLLTGVIAVVVATLFAHSHWPGHATVASSSSAVDAASPLASAANTTSSAMASPALGAASAAATANAQSSPPDSMAPEAGVPDATGSDAASADSAAASDESQAASGPSSASKSKPKRRAKPHRREPKRNFIQRWWHRI